MNADQINQLKRLAEASLKETQAQWVLDEDGWIDSVVVYDGCGTHTADWEPNSAKYVCAANPSTIIKLIDSHEQLQKEIVNLKQQLIDYQERYSAALKQNRTIEDNFKAGVYDDWSRK